jgi:hypothetical protein
MEKYKISYQYIKLNDETCSSKLSSSKGNEPLNRIYKITPSDHMSAAKSYRPCFATLFFRFNTYHVQTQNDERGSSTKNTLVEFDPS